ncbi:hypothetical protein BC567DRAFT_29380 [Phyllosticta citribraziliensis]
MRPSGYPTALMRPRVGERLFVYFTEVEQQVYMRCAYSQRWRRAIHMYLSSGGSHSPTPILQPGHFPFLSTWRGSSTLRIYVLCRSTRIAMPRRLLFSFFGSASFSGCTYRERPRHDCLCPTSVADGEAQQVTFSSPRISARHRRCTVITILIPTDQPLSIFALPFPPQKRR